MAPPRLGRTKPAGAVSQAMRSARTASSARLRRLVSVLQQYSRIVCVIVSGVASGGFCSLEYADAGCVVVPVGFWMRRKRMQAVEFVPTGTEVERKLMQAVEFVPAVLIVVGRICLGCL